jgi:restriction system protein
LVHARSRGTNADDLGLTEAERSEEIPSGGTTVISSRVHWAKTYLKQAGLLEQPKRAYVQASQRGGELLAGNPPRIDLAMLQQFGEFRAFLGRTKSDGAAAPSSTPLPVASRPVVAQPSTTPEEQIEIAYRTLDESLRDALLTRILESTPSFFERMIIDLLLAMGYGSAIDGAGERLGGTGDGGVDGVIREDQLGLDRVYLQAKRYQPGNTVGSGAVQAFIGALMGKGAQKGVLITTSTFTQAAMTAASQLNSLRIVLIDGEELTRLLTRFNVGVRMARTIAIKRVDLDCFEVAETE